MKKLTFKVSSPKDCSVVSLIKEVNKISCRIYLDLENGYVVVENVNDTMIDIIIELVDNYYTILGVEIDNTSEEPAEEQHIPTVVETAEESTVSDAAEESTVSETVEEATASDTVEMVSEKHPTVLEPQSEDDLIIKKVEFENELVETRINNLLRTAYWALYNKQATEKEISEYILTCMSEISMRYSAKPIIEFAIGDIVDVNFGSHLPGEITGGHVHAIVCHMLNDNVAYVVPLTKARTNINSQSYLIMDAPQDAIYNNESYTGSTALIDKSRYVRVERFNSIMGKTKPDFFKKLLQQLASAFDFTGCLVEAGAEVSETFAEIEATTDEEAETPSEVEVATDEEAKTPSEVEVATDEEAKTPTAVESATDEEAEKRIETAVDTITPVKKSGDVESALLEVIGTSFDRLDKSKSIEEQVASFMVQIGMPITAKLVAQSFVIACDIKKINYENVICGLHTLNPYIDQNIIKVRLQETFKSWLERYPTLAEKYPKISLMSLLKVFAKKFA